MTIALTTSFIQAAENPLLSMLNFFLFLIRAQNFLVKSSLVQNCFMSKMDHPLRLCWTRSLMSWCGNHSAYVVKKLEGKGI